MVVHEVGGLCVELVEPLGVVPQRPPLPEGRAARRAGVRLGVRVAQTVASQLVPLSEALPTVRAHVRPLSRMLHSMSH